MHFIVVKPVPCGTRTVFVQNAAGSPIYTYNVHFFLPAGGDVEYEVPDCPNHDLAAKAAAHFHAQAHGSLCYVPYWVTGICQDENCDCGGIRTSYGRVTVGLTA